MKFAQSLRLVGGVVSAGVLLLTVAPVASADQVREDQWPLKAFRAEEVWQVSQGEGVTVAVIDDGVDAQHPDLKRNVLDGKDFLDGGAATPDPGADHGTAMAGIIAAHGHGPGGSQGVMGLAPAAKILPIRDDGARAEGFAPSIRYAVDHGASVINISQESPDPKDAERAAIAYALKKDVLVVAGTGNDGTGPEKRTYPAYYPGVLAVGGVERNGELWKDSNYGPAVLLTAPAGGIVSTGGGTESFPYRKGSGTSDATAYVSAAAALLRAEYPDLTAGQIANRLTKTAGLPASAKGISLPDEKYGYGFIQPLAALGNDIPPGPRNGPLKTPEVPLPTGSATPDNNAPSTDGAAPEAKAGGGKVLIVGVGAAVLLAVVVGVVLMTRRSRRKGAS